MTLSQPTRRIKLLVSSHFGRHSPLELNVVLVFRSPDGHAACFHLAGIHFVAFTCTTDPVCRTSILLILFRLPPASSFLKQLYKHL